jgi:hypothetical protein
MGIRSFATAQDDKCPSEQSEESAFLFVAYFKWPTIDECHRLICTLHTLASAASSRDRSDVLVPFQKFSDDTVNPFRLRKKVTMSFTRKND